ncbi:MAG: hypothetical protein WBA57_12275 [Elainellaceae cyanobacterium]
MNTVGIHLKILALMAISQSEAMLAKAIGKNSGGDFDAAASADGKPVVIKKPDKGLGVEQEKYGQNSKD